MTTLGKHEKKRMKQLRNGIPIDMYVEIRRENPPVAIEKETI